MRPAHLAASVRSGNPLGESCVATKPSEEELMVPEFYKPLPTAACRCRP